MSSENNKIDDGGPAFPTGVTEGAPSPEYYGLTIRDYLAAHLEQSEAIYLTETNKAELAGPRPTSPIENIEWQARADAKFRYIRADAMLAARKEQDR